MSWVCVAGAIMFAAIGIGFALDDVARAIREHGRKP